MLRRLNAKGTSDAGGETNSSQDMVYTESPIEETGTSETVLLWQPLEGLHAVILQELDKLLYDMTQLIHSVMVC